MKKSGLWLLVGASALLFDSGAAQAQGRAQGQGQAQGPGQAQAACDRACLESVLDAYLGAVVANDPEAAPIVVGVRQTENALNVAPGRGVWQSVTGLGDVQRRYFDPVSGQALYFGTVKEGDATAIVSARVRVEGRQITEAEWYLARENDPGMTGPRQPGSAPANRYNLEYFTQNAPPARTVPAAERADRATLIRIVESYFDAITSHDPSVALTHEGCGRVENGSPAPAGAFLPQAQRAVDPAPSGSQRRPGQGAPQGPPPGPPGPPGAGGATVDCVWGLENFNLSMVVARRVPLVDVEAQAVLAYGVFIRRPGSPVARNAFSELFFIDENRIRTLYAAMFYPPPELAVPNWPPYEGHWPLPSGIVPAASAP